MVPCNEKYMLLGNLFKLNGNSYMLTDRYGMIDSIGKKTGIKLKIKPSFLNKNLVSIFLLIPKMIFRFVNIFESDKKGREKLEKFFREKDKNDFKAVIIIPENI